MNAFEIQNISGKGRALIATKSFEIADVIFEEEPFVACQFSWNSAYGYSACDHCLRPLETTIENIRRLANNPTLVLPLSHHCPTSNWIQQFTVCPKCKVRYCSEDCRMDALNRYHKVACMGPYRCDETHPINVLNETWKKMHYPPETGTIMMVVRLMALYQQSNNKSDFIKQLQAFQSLSVNTEKKIYHKILGGNFEQQMERLFAAFINAFPSDEFAPFTTLDSFKSLMTLIGTNSQGIATSPFAEWVRKVTEVPMLDSDKVKLNEYIDNLYKQIGDFSGEFLNNEGSGLYALQSKINHSCVPNAQSTFPYSNNIVVLKAVAPIQISDEICISYLDDCQLQRSRHSRQKILKENYIFLCECNKCKLQAQDPDETSEDDEMETDESDNEMKE